MSRIQLFEDRVKIAHMTLTVTKHLVGGESPAGVIKIITIPSKSLASATEV
jgi:hypothetical protein